MDRFRAAFPLLALLLVAGCSSVEDTAVPPAELPDYEPAARLDTVWRRDVGSAFTRKWVRMTPVLYEDAAYAANVDGVVAAFGIEEGRRLWQVALDQRLAAGVGVDDERVYVGTVEGDVIALDRDNGREIWRHVAGGELLAQPAAGDGLVVARTVDGRVIALSAADGSRRWTYSTDVPSLSLRGNSRPILVSGGVVVGLDNGRVAALAWDSGEPIWEVEVAPPEGRSPIERMVDIDGAMAVGRNVLYAATYQGQVAQIEPQQGNIRWSREISSYFGLGVDDERLYVTNADSHVRALSPGTGEPLWSQDKLHHRRLTAAVPVPDSPWLALGDFDGYIHLLARGDGRVVARKGLGGFGVLADPVPAGNGRILVQTQGAELMLLRAREID